MNTTNLVTTTDSQRQLRHARQRISWGLAGIGLITATLLAASALILWPYHPMAIEDYEAVPEIACPSQTITVYADYTIEQGARIQAMEINSYWEAVDVTGFAPGVKIPAATATITSDDPRLLDGRHTTPGPITRIAPARSGKWRLTSEITIRGNLWPGVPHIQHIDATSKNDTLVLTENPDETSRPCPGGTPTQQQQRRDLSSTYLH